MKLSNTQRVLLHTFIGFFYVLCLAVHWALSLIMAISFIAYELDECHHLKDKAYIDLAGSMVGLVVSAAAVLLWRVLQ